MAIGLAAALGLGLSAVGTAAGVAGQVMSMNAAKKAEKLRERQMDLDTARQKREIARQAIVARSTALSSATEQGAQMGSGLQGGQAQITGSANQGILAANQNQEIGAGIFAANRKAASGNMLSSFGNGLSGLGGMFLQNQELFGRVGTYYAQRPA